MVTPSGFEVEYGWGGGLIDDSVWQGQRPGRGTLWGHKVQVEPARHVRGRDGEPRPAAHAMTISPARRP